MKFTLVKGNDPKKVAFGLQEGDKVTQVEAKKAFETLRSLTSKGELGFGGKKLLFDPFVVFKVTIEILGCELHPYFVYKTQKVPFNVCPLILSGAEHLFVYEGIIRSFEGGFPKMERLFAPLVIFSPKEIEDFIDAYAIDPPEWGPLVEVIERHESPIFPEAAIDAECIIQLTDESGAFVEVEIKNGTAALEKRFFQDLADVGYVYKPMGKSNYYCPTHLVKGALSLLQGMGVKILGPDQEEVYFLASLTKASTLKKRGLSVQGELKVGTSTFSFVDALDATKKGKVILRRKEGSLFLDHEELEVFAAIPHKIIGNHLEVKRVFAPQLSQRLENIGIEGLVPYQHQPTSPHFKGELFPFQQEGVNWLQFHYDNQFAALLADEMGLGKTVQTIAFMSRFAKDKKVLIIAPLTLLSQWKQEIQKFCPKLLDQVTLLSYQTVRSTIETLEKTSFELLILDEAQSLRNRKTKGFEAVRRIKAEFKIALSGTPIENRVTDLTNLFEILLPELVHEIDFTDLDRIKVLTKPFILRRLKKEVVREMPEKMEQIVYLDLYDDQKEAYQDLKQESIRDLRDNKTHVFAIITKLRQHVLSPKLVNQPLASSKLDRVLEELIELVESGQKILVFSHFSGLLHLLEKELEELKIPYFYLDGQTRHRDRVVDAFKKHEGGAPFLMTLKAGGVGLNLVEADTVMIFEPWWNPHVENQAIDRAHRMGRDKPLIARRYIAVHTIEEHIEKIKVEKSDLANQIIEDSEVSHEILERLLEDLL
ncbi:MAG: DEAD/DEAH box helicase [Chlamydiia bacterium]